MCIRDSYWGFGESLRRGLPDAARDHVLLLGAGGAGHAVAHALVDAGVRQLLVRDMNQALADELEDVKGMAQVPCGAAHC